MASEQDQLLASRQEGWNGFARFLFWGTIDVAVITLIATLFYINGPGWGVSIVSVVLFLVFALINAVAVFRS
jgi:FtsH-binding integral membrane protein